jgi:hypothetical protein
MTEIFINFTKGGLRRSKKVKASLAAPGQYVIEQQPYDPAIEIWDFPPGAKVKCDTIVIGGKKILFAKERVD